ncbi:GIY-YIG nuclease family protein [Bombilactobacillus folatiphilus]|uniref:GIY-YIG nuclease family protein n=1 Tax=Bombilactobacillus folatiphilus TaxID=2923362 RepID=A0ABY4P8A1_9LACO|nr:GIY-YIG nuclease family protein [Bombilactobacillus folatiphilus]UQS81820.1 GIY-YIG nuclease family protein [Bombilactobacillus folatiphilus]
MERHGKSIEIYLMDGDANGRCEVMLANWNVTAYKLPNDLVVHSQSLTNINTPGVYLLFGEENGKNFVYVGESENVLMRLGQHLPDNDGYLWQNAIVFVANRRGTLDKAKIKYLENRLYNIIKSIGTYQLKNRNEPRKSSLSQANEDAMEAVLDNIELLVPVMGHDPFKGKSELTESFNTNSPNILQFKSQTLKAQCNQNKNGTFTILAGAQIRPQISASLSKKITELRQQLQSNGQIKNNILQQTLNVSSSSAAADFILGYPVDGQLYWVTTTGSTLKQFKNAQTGKVVQPAVPQEMPQKDLELYLKNKIVNTRGLLHQDKTFTLLPGSQIRAKVQTSMPQNIAKLRSQIQVDEQWILQKSITVKSVSAAAELVLGTSANGKLLWKTIDGVSVGDWLEKNN